MAVIILSLIFGIYNCFTEIIIRIDAVQWRYILYYLIPIRGHMLLAIVSVIIIIGMCLYRNKNLVMRSITICVNILYVVLWIDTLLLA